MESGIYIIRNIVNQKIYVGQSSKIKKRWFTHKSKLRGNYHYNKHLQRDWNKYGEICFEFIVSQYCLTEQLTYQEQAAFNYFKKFVETYNHGEFTDSGMRGKKHSVNTRQLMREKRKKQIFTQETRDKIGKAKKGNKNTLGLKHTDETRILIGTKNIKFSVERIDMITGEIKEYLCVNDAKKDGFDSKSINKCLRDLSKKHNGYFWTIGKRNVKN